MTLDQVIQAGQISYSSSIFTESIWWFVIIVLLLIIGVTLIKITEMEYGFGWVLIAGLVCILLLVFHSFSDNNKNEQMIKQWKQEMAMPYINSLPTEKREVVFLKIEPQLSHNTQGSLFYTYSVPVKLTPLTISFKGNGIETYTNWYETHMELTKEQQPYITYKKLDKDLGNGVKSGIYDVKVYLPESYKFTDIK